MIRLHRGNKNFIIWAQKNICLLCGYPLDLNKHFHHIIARDDGGPDHYLNLVALCPNHHWLVERIKRHIIPNQKSSSDHLLRSSMAALQLYNELTKEEKHTLDILSTPHKLSKAVKQGVPEDFLKDAANALMKEDAKILDDINKKRPRIFLPPKSLRNPDDTVDAIAEEIAGKVGLSFYSDVITEHMKKLKLHSRPL